MRLDKKCWMRESRNGDKLSRRESGGAPLVIGDSPEMITVASPNRMN
jgi:hypothetical protein